MRRVRGSFRDSFRGSFRGSLKKYGSIDHNKSDKQATWYFRNGEWRISYDDGEEVSLMYAKHERIPMKDFGAEVRASMDVARFLTKAVVLLDIPETSLEEIVEKMLHKMLDTSEPQCNINSAKAAFFTQDSVHLLAKTIQGTSSSAGGGFDYDQSWVCALCNLVGIAKRHVAIARLKHPANFGPTSQEIRFVILIIAPTKEKGTKNALETGRTFATMFADMDFRQSLLDVKNEEEFKKLLLKHTRDLAEEQSHPERKIRSHDIIEDDSMESSKCRFAFGLKQDFLRRIPHYLSDYSDGILGHNTLQKLISTTLFLYFACLLPSIAFGVLNDTNTATAIGIKKVIFSQTIGGLFFGIFGGQPLIVLLTTAPIALYTKIIYSISIDFRINFFALYACVGLWNTFFLLLYALFDVSRLMKWATRSTEEIFAVFISIAFSVDAFRAAYYDFQKNYFGPGCFNNTTDESKPYAETSVIECLKENSLLYILLMFGTLWLGVYLYNFNKTPFLNAGKREMLTDYALPVAVISLSFVGSYIFRHVKLEPFRYKDDNPFEIAPLHLLSIGGIFGSMGMGVLLSLLFFMDQNISSALVNHPTNKLRKGPAYHLDLFVVALLNAFLSIFGLPWIHAALPHSPLHVRALADVEERVDQGHVYEIIVRVRETRLTVLLSHILIGLSIFMLPYPLAYIPKAVLDGLFLYVAITALKGNEMFDRILLLVTEQAAYPPNHYIRRVPQRKVHIFTVCQIMQLFMLCAFGFAPFPYMKMVFPVILFLLLPIRHKIVPRIIDKKYLEALDGH